MNINSIQLAATNTSFFITLQSYVQINRLKIKDPFNPVTI